MLAKEKNFSIKNILTVLIEEKSVLRDYQKITNHFLNIFGAKNNLKARSKSSNDEGYLKYAKSVKHLFPKIEGSVKNENKGNKLQLSKKNIKKTKQSQKKK